MSEIHFGDLYPEAFQEFRKKYSKVLKSATGQWLFVNFTNHSVDPLERNANPNPPHGDPAAVYAYPLEYVLKYPADVWYGAKSKYLRVLRAKPKHTLYLNGLKWDNCERILYKMGFDDPGGRMLRAKKEFRHSGVNAPAKSMLSVIQLSSMTKVNGEYPMRSAVEQTALFRKAGYDAIRDNSTNDRIAVLNAREPDQMAFLTRHAFEVVETFILHQEDEEKLLVVNSPAHDDRWMRKFAAKIAMAIGDRLVNDGPPGGERTNLMGWRYFWTKAGRRIEVLTERPYSFYKNKRIGQKKHKQERVAQEYEVRAIVRSEFGDVETMMYDDKEKLDAMIDRIAVQFNTLRQEQKPSAWKPQTHDQYLKDADSSRRYHMIGRLLSDYTEDIPAAKVGEWYKEFPELFDELPADRIADLFSGKPPEALAKKLTAGASRLPSENDNSQLHPQAP